MSVTNQMRAFISHNHEDVAYSIEISQELKHYGVTTWIDEEKLNHGELLEHIGREIYDCNVFIVILSSESLNSRWVIKECNTALALNHDDPSKILLLVTGNTFDVQDLNRSLTFLAGKLRIEKKGTGVQPFTPKEAAEEVIHALELLPRPKEDGPSLLKLESEELFKRGRALLAQGKFVDAFPHLFYATHNDPTFIDAWYCRGETLLGLDQPNEALASYDRARLQAITNFEQMRRQRGAQKAEATKTYQEKRVIGWYGYGQALMKLDRYKEAFDAFNEVLRIEPKNVRAIVGKAKAQLELKHRRKAIRTYEKALTLNNLADQASIGKGRALLELGRDQEALLTIEHAIAADTENPDSWAMKATLLRQVRKPVRSRDIEECYRVAIRMIPSEEKAYLRKKAGYLKELGDFYYQQDTVAALENALTEYIAATEIDAKDKEAWQRISLIAGKLGGKTEILSKAQEVIQKIS